MRIFVSLTLLLGLCWVPAGAEETVEYSRRLTIDNFNDEISRNNHFVKFYAPWCTHCKRIHPTWEELAKLLNRQDDSGPVTIAKVDCTVDTALCSEHDITGYPTLKFFSQNAKEGVKFKGTRDIVTLTGFLNEQLGVNVLEEQESAKPDKLEKGIVELTDDNYKEFLSKGDHFVKFYAPWCGHCQKMAPTWEEIATKYAEDNSVNICKIDCTLNRDACAAFEIKSYPSLLWISNGEKVEKYQGSRTLDELSTYIDEMKSSGEPKKETQTFSVHEELSPVISLTGNNFKDRVKTGYTFVKFFAPWCGHCKGLAPTWEELGKKYMSEKRITIAKVDCTEEANKELCNEEEVDGFPTLVMYKDGTKIAEYNGARGLAELSEFISKQTSHDEL